MIYRLWVIALFLSQAATAQPGPEKKRNIFIITTDGFRWQEVFNGADARLLSDPGFVKDTAIMRQLYWDDSAAVRRQKLMPFFWNVIAKQGCLYGNRQWNNKVNVRNFYKISYPGYSEMLTGFADRRFIPNFPIANRNTNVLEFLNEQKDYQGKVVAFSSWNILPYILNERPGSFPVNAGYETLEESSDTAAAVNRLQAYITNKGDTRYDMLTWLSVQQYVERHHPKVVFLGLGETDECAHRGRYDLYLQKAADVDRMIGALWYYVQTDPFYKDNTTFIITTDHGRGKHPGAWQTHGFWARGSGEMWLAVIGPDVYPAGEIKEPQQMWQQQIAATISMLLGEEFEAEHKVAKPAQLRMVSRVDSLMSKGGRVDRGSDNAAQ
jgi:hypothetical protein